MSMWVLGISAAVKIGTDMVAANKAKKDAQGAANSLVDNVPQLDPNQINTTVQNQAVSNAALSNQLEQQYNPTINALRGTAGNNLLSYLALNSPQDRPGALSQGPLSQLAYQKALTDLQHSGQLPTDVANQIMRASAAQAGGVVGSGNGLGLLGRDLSARDLGLNSLQLYNQQLQNAQNIGNTADQYALQQQLQNANLQQQGFNNALQATQLGQSVSMPKVGLDPSSVANIYAGNANALAQAQAQATAMKLGGQNSQTKLWGDIGGTLSGFIGGFSNLGSLASTASQSNQGSYGLNYAPGGGGLYSYGGSCWVAREVYGTETTDWTRFRQWLLTEADPELKRFYLAHGVQIADDIRGNENVKTLIRHLMNAARNNPVLNPATA